MTYGSPSSQTIIVWLQWSHSNCQFLTRLQHEGDVAQGEKRKRVRLKKTVQSIRLSAMTISIDVPEDMISRLRASWGDLPRRALEALAVEAYRDEVLSSAEVGRLLEHSTRWETEAFLQEKQAYLHYSEEDLRRDMETIRKATGK